jgi:hypothetical protein
VGSDSFTFTASDGLLQSAAATVSITISGGAGALPAGWASASIGATGLPGSSTYDAGLGRFYLAGAGLGITGTSDQCRYTWGAMSGDGDIYARLTTVDATPATAVAGVMIRETTDAGSVHHFLGRRNDGQLVWVRRSLTGKSTSISTSGTVPLPCWLRLTRVGGTITAYSSTNGTVWTKVNNTKLTMAATVTAGLAVSSGSTTTLVNAAFDNVRLTQ